MKIDHFAFEVSDLEASIHFYTQKLGFRVQLGKTVDEKEHEAFAILELEGGRLELLQALSEENQPMPFTPLIQRPHSCPHLALQVENFDRAIARLAEAGIPILNGPLEMPGAVKWLYFCDPDRNMIEFVQNL